MQNKLQPKLKLNGGSVVVGVIFLFCSVVWPAQGLPAESGTPVVQSQQTKTVEGAVKDDKGEPVVGASVIIKGTTQGTATDVNGKFKLDVPDGSVLVVSSLGYAEAEVNVNHRTFVEVTLATDSEMLESVQVIAYGTQSLISVTGSMSSVKTDDLVRIPNASVTNALAGAMPGVSAVQSIGQPGMEDASLYIRGSSTLGTGDDTPLVLVDGVERSFSQLDPNEIADITILKDASSTAVFGVRGANGVILVTTRRGNEGKAQISISSNVSVQMPMVLIENADSYTTALLYNEKLDSDNSSKARFSDYALQAFKTGSDPMIFPNTDWRELMFRDAYMQTQHNINISGGTDRVRYFTSLSYLFQDGLLKKFETLDYDNRYFYNRFNYRANLDIDLTKTTLAKINIGGVVGKRHQPRGHNDGLWRQINWSAPYSAPGMLTEDGHPMAVGSGYLPVASKTGWSAFYGLGFQEVTKNDLNIDLQIEQQLDFITKGLKAHVKGSYNTTFTQTVNRNSNVQTYNIYYEGSKTQPGMDLSDPDFNKNVIYEITGNDQQLQYGENFGRTRNWYIEAALNYKRTFGGVHRVSGLLLYNQNRVYYPRTSAGAAMDYQYIPRSYAGLVARATYGYDNRYLFDINVGYNGSENFAPGKTRFGVFPSGSIGWVISEENFMKNQSVISFLKLRASYGLVGNDKISTDRFLYLPGVWTVDGGGYNFGTDITVKDPAATEGQMGNPGVTWEKSAKQNYGIDLKMFDNKLSISADYFREHRYDILISRNTAPGILAMQLPKLNMGEVANHGYELSIKWNHTMGKVTYWINGNVSFARNEVLYMDEVEHKNDFNYQTGRSTNLTYGYEFLRFYREEDFADPTTGQLNPGVPVPTFGSPRPGDCMYADKDGDGDIDTDDQTYLGYSTKVPEYTYGLTLGLKWKGLEFSMLWTAATHVSRLLSNEYRIPFSPNGTRALFQYHADNRWTPETAETATLPRFTDTNKGLNYTPNSSLWVRDASYLRLKNLQLSYTFRNNRWLRAVGLKNMSIYLSGYNLLTFDHIKFIDPEAPANGGNTNQYPIARIYTAGLKLNF